ncbi:MAG: energy-coupling factor transporter ATPase [Lachnospiraceae bacterium]|nr:energy-coupling factor transporter ATPase [Lachnospiraceae bacterium]
MQILAVEHFSFAYPDVAKASLKDVSFEVEAGSFNVLCGKSGCGKSTLLRHLKRELAPFGHREGTIRYRGTPIGELPDRDAAEKIGYVLQNPDNQIVTDKVWHELAFGLESLGYDTPTIRLRVAEMASYFGIQDWFLKNVSELSGGQKQLLNLAAVMAMHPELLILDEPTSQLDPIAASDFLETVRKLNRDVGTTIIITEHRLEDIIPWADQVLVMDKGTLIARGKPSDIGVFLQETRHDMFEAMPTPMRIYAGTDSKAPCPLTVREGRAWLRNTLEEMGLPADRPIHFNKKIADDENAAASASTDQSDHRIAAGSQAVLWPTDSERTDVSGRAADKEIPAIALKDVWFRYDRDLPDVVKGLNMTVNKGEFFALVGGNGTGKSTTLSLLSGLRRPYRGKILLNGRDIVKYTDEELYYGFLGVLPQNPQTLFTSCTVREDLYAMIDGMKEKKSRFYPIDMKKSEAIAGISELTMLDELMDRHPYDLSGGEQQRLALAKILLLRPQILLMDEPTKGLDNHYKNQLGRILKTLTTHGVTIFMISHDVEFCAAFADRTGLFFQGDLVASDASRRFFSGNSYYTTAANRLARTHFPDAVSAEDVIAAIHACQAEVTAPENGATEGSGKREVATVANAPDGDGVTAVAGKTVGHEDKV